MKELKFKTIGEKVKVVRGLMKSVGNHIGSVWFVKKTDGTKRRMAYRLHVSKPQYASVPSGKKVEKKVKENLLVVFDANKIRYNKKGNMCGRGDYRSVPLENVTRLKVCGEIYKIIG